jgi:hypothetical protein
MSLTFVLLCAVIAVRSADTSYSAAPTTSPPCAQIAPSGAGSAVPATPGSLEEEVVANLKQQKIGSATLADLDLPEEYLKRVAGRILRASFEENFRIVVPDVPSADAESDTNKKSDMSGKSDTNAKSATNARSAVGANSQASVQPPQPPSTSPPGSDSASVAREPGRSSAAGFAAMTSVLWICGALGVCLLAIFLGLRRMLRGRARSR